MTAGRSQYMRLKDVKKKLVCFCKEMYHLGLTTTSYYMSCNNMITNKSLCEQY